MSTFSTTKTKMKTEESKTNGQIFQIPSLSASGSGPAREIEMGRWGRSLVETREIERFETLESPRGGFGRLGDWVSTVSGREI